MENAARTLSGLNVLAGIWLIVAPFVLNYSSTGNTWQEVVFGAIVIILGLVRMAAPHISWPNYINGIIGVWLIIAPWTLSGASTAARWNEVIVGIIVFLLALSSSSASVPTRHGHHLPLH